VKRSALDAGSFATLFCCVQSSGFNDSNTFAFEFRDDTLVASGGNSNFRIASQVFRDLSAWYHILIAVDTTQATASSRIKMYVNGTEITAWTTINNPSQYSDLGINQNTQHVIGSIIPLGFGRFFNGYLADIHFIDGQALTPTSFGEFSATTGVWVPKAYTGTYGTNGFQLKFEDNSSNTATTLGKDTSGAGNNWTPVNLSTTTGGPTSVASASGALPIYNTTDTYGTTKGTGTRTDSNSSSIVLALPMDGTNNGTTFTDESATIKGSGSAKTLTRNGDTKTVTSQSKFYGSSGSFDGTGDYLSHGANTDFAFGTGDLTVELWVYFNSLPGSGVAGLVDTGTSVNANRFSVVVYPNGATYVDSNVNLIVGTAGKITTGKWIHLAVCRSGTNATLYINGVADKTSTVSTDFSNNLLRVGATIDNLYLNGYIQDLRIYKGVAKYTGNFNPPSSTANATVASGNDSLVDVPTNGSEVDTGLGGQVRGNYCTLNPLAPITSNTFRDGNLNATVGDASSVRGTIAFSSSKFYWEVTSSDYTRSQIGICAADNVAVTPQSTATGWTYFGENGSAFNNGSGAAYGSALNVNDILGIAVDMDAGKLWWSVNGTWQASGNPATGANAAFTGLTGAMVPLIATRGGYGSGNFVANFGQRPFAYTAPSGFKALNTANLPAPLVTKPSDLFDMKLITANNSTQVITGLAFSPDLVWTKSRSNAYSHYLYDTVRGVQKPLISNATNAESTIATSLTSFNSDGFTLGADDGANYSSGSSVAWCWDAGSSTVTNTQGSISSQVRANASAGFSVITWTGQTAAGTIGHGLGVAPSLIICKARSNAQSWGVYHKDVGINNYLLLDSTGASTAFSGIWGSSAPTSTVFGVPGNVGLNNNNGWTYVGYCFAPVAGYSSFGSYTGNGSADGPFVYLGFRPAVVLVKMSSSTGNWTILDDKREGYNVDNDPLYPNLSNAEGTTDLIDITSNGFKVRTTDATFNTNAGTYIYAAWASSPFAYSRAR
jgi:hypothetical protein